MVDSEGNNLKSYLSEEDIVKVLCLFKKNWLSVSDFPAAEIQEISVVLKEGLNPEHIYLYDNPKLDGIIRKNSAVILKAAKEYGVDPDIIAGLILLEQSQISSYSLSNLSKRFSKKAGWDFVIPTPDWRISENVTDVVKGVAFGDSTVGLGQIWMKTARRLRLQNIDPDISDTKLVYKLRDPKFNIRCMAEYVGIIV